MTKLDAISLGLIFFAVLVIILGIIKVHTYPGKIAKARNHPQTEAIEVTSLLGLIMFPLWMAALVWAYSGAVIGRLYTQPEQQGTGTAVKNERPKAPPAKKADDSATEAEV